MSQKLELVYNLELRLYIFVSKVYMSRRLEVVYNLETVYICVNGVHVLKTRVSVNTTLYTVQP